MAHLKFSHVISAPRDRVFESLVDVGRLGIWLAPDVDVRVNHLPAELKRGSEASVELTRFGLAQATRWRIEDVLRGSSLTFRQVEGIFAAWTHTMRFEDTEGGGTRVTEEVRYRLPGGWLGRVADGLVVARDLERILRRRLGRVGDALKPARAS